jgi:hypothetical protein
MLKGCPDNMTPPDVAGGNPRQKKKFASRAAKRRAQRPRKRGATGPRRSGTNGTRKPDISLEEKVAVVEPPLSPPVGRLERTRRLVLAAVRVWELRWRIRD